ncbi:hypothetical protein MBANPS3_000941 [Mucor bainieri]
MGKLIRIEVENFKSYKGHQTIGPFHQFTSVIGPNGAGKSNLMDAISFVLGVHSSHLRSQNLKDMIYRSEALRKEGDPSTPSNNSSSSVNTRAPKKAHVTAVYETSQGREVRFMRVINTNGQSEYRINDRVVQYTDYNKALEKENILVKAKNFLVFQGDVESVASQHPKDLTRLIEQISGSWDYRDQYDDLKQKRDEAIEESAHTFNKKRGIAAEIKLYEEQKEEADKFEKLVVDKRDLTVQYLLWKLFHVEEKARALEEESSAKNADKDDLQFEVAGMEDNFKKAREEKALIHREKIKCELHIRKINRELDEQHPTSVSNMEKIAQLEKKIKQTEQSIERIKRDGQQQEQVVASLEKDLELLQHTEQQFEASIPTTAGLANGPVLTGAQLMDYERRKQEVSIKAVEEQHLLQQYQRQYKTEKQRLDEQQSKMEKLQAAEAETLDALRQANEEKATLTLEAETIQERLGVRQSELKKLEHERTTTHQRETKLNEKLQEVLNKLMEASVTQQESDKDSRFNESVATLKQIYPNVHGKLSDLCRPNQRKYDTAIATVLGRNMDAIVVEDEQTAAECIEYMREQHVGVATFLPIHSLSLPPINDRYRNFVRGARLAYDVLKFDKQYDSVVQYACGSTLICDTLAIAKQICFEMNENVRTVTLDGSVIHQSGLMTGGQTGAQTTKKWAQSDVEELMRSRDKLLEELNQISKTKRMGTAEDSAKSDCSNLSSQLKTLEEELTTLESRIQGLQGTLENTRQNLAAAVQPYEQHKHALSQLEANIQRVQEEINRVEDHIFEDFCAEINVPTIRDYEAMQYGVSDEVTEQRAQFASQKSRLETQLAFEKDQLNELIARLKKLETTLSNDATQKRKLEADVAGMAGKTEQLQAKLKSFEVDLQKQTHLEEQKQIDINEVSRALEAKGKNVEELLREFRAVESEYEKVRAERVAIFRKCKLEGINLPLTRGSMDDIIIEETNNNNATQNTDDNASVSDTSSVAGSVSSSVVNSANTDMDLDVPVSQMSIQSTDWEVEVDFSSVGAAQRRDDSARLEHEFQEQIKKYADEIEQMAPNLKAVSRLEGVHERLKQAEQEFNAARATAKSAKEAFNLVKQKRYGKFFAAFSHISEKIDTVYKDLTKSPTFTLGGTAYLTAEDEDEPYLEGITYHAMPPMKRFRDMEQLSGGEKSVAALALLFAIHSFKPSPFFVLDEVDAALDNTNVSTVASYIRQHATPDFQFIVISLKHTLYEKAESLVGIYRDQDLNSSKTMTLMTALNSYVGFDTITQQIEKKSLKRGFQFNVMVVGQTGLGKSTLVNTLFASHLIDSKGRQHVQDLHKQTTQIESVSHVIEENGVRLRLNIVDTPGYGDQVDNENCWEPIIKYVKDQHSAYLRKELTAQREKVIQDNRVHCCLYFIAPSGHSLKPIDVIVLKKLVQVVNVVPVIAKSDSLTIEERNAFKQRINAELAFHQIDLYPYDTTEDYDDEERALNAHIRQLLPFAVVGSERQVVVNGKAVIGRKNRWGTIIVEDENHCEFIHLRNFLTRTHLQDLVETTAMVHYETFRSNQLMALKGAVAATSPTSEIPTSPLSAATTTADSPSSNSANAAIPTKAFPPFA